MPGLEDLYREIILDHYRTPRNRGELPAPPALLGGTRAGLIGFGWWTPVWLLVVCREDWSATRRRSRSRFHAHPLGRL